MEYVKTEDPNVYKKIQTLEDDICIDKLEYEIKRIKDDIANIPKKKTKPDQETLDYWNIEFVEMQNEAGQVAMLEEKQDLLAMLKALK